MFARSLRGWQQLLAGCFALWIAALSVDLPILHTCSMHGMGGIAARAVATSDAHHNRTGAHEPASGEHSSGRHGCTCLGQCCAATRVALPTVEAALSLASFAAPVVVVEPLTDIASSWSGFALPFATAPPRP